MVDWATYSPPPSTLRTYTVNLPAGCHLEPDLEPVTPHSLLQTAEEELAEWRASQRELNQTLRAFGYKPVRLRSELPVIERSRRRKTKPTASVPARAEPEPKELVAKIFDASPQEPFAAAKPQVNAWDQWHALSSSLPDIANLTVIYPSSAIDLYVHHHWLQGIFAKLFRRSDDSVEP